MIRAGRLWLAALVVSLGPGLAGSEPPPLTQLNREDLPRQLKSDQQAMLTYRAGLRSILTFQESRPDLFPAEQLPATRLLRREEKEAVWAAWQRFLDYLLALDALAKRHHDFFRLKGEGREGAFLIAHAAHTARYRFALAFVQRAENDPNFDKLLNDAVPELGLPGGVYRQLKFRFLNVMQAGQFAAWESAAQLVGGAQYPLLRQAIREDQDWIWAFGKGPGEKLTVLNGLQILKDAGFKAWFPVQAGASEWMGDTKVYRQGVALISKAQIQALLARLEPGDILLARNEWFLSNIGLPGFWPHGALFIGTAAERRKYFDDAAVRAWVREQGQGDGDFEELLQAKYPRAYSDSLRPQEGGHPARVLEAISEGVSFTALEHTAGCDSFAALRPRLAKRDKAVALLRAFHYAGRPYDFNFDFQTDSALVCTELVYKAYEPATAYRGLIFPLSTVLGRPVVPANEIVRHFDAQWGTPAQQTDLVIFLDGQERARKAVEAEVTVFRESWKRPKWHVLTQNSGSALPATAGRTAEIKPDETVVFYPTLGWRGANGAGWEIEIHGCVYELEKRALLLPLLRRAVGLKEKEMEAEERRLFAERARLFLADNERGKNIAIELAGQTFVVGPSQPNGHFQGHWRLGQGGLEAPRLATGGPVAELAFRMPMGQSGGRPFGGTVQLLENDGLSVVSDLDDTVKISHVRDRRALLKHTFCRPFQPVPGMAELYRHWAQNQGASFHYVSASPWQLYVPLSEFLQTNGFPRGSFHLKSFRLKDETVIEFFASPTRYKPTVIEPLFKRYPQRRFVLVGDSGEQDPEIYGKLARKYPRQVVGIFIRDVTGETAQAKRYQKAFQGVPADRWRIFRAPAEIQDALRIPAPP